MKSLYLALILLSLSFSGVSQTITSSGVGSGFWDDALSWTPNTVPTNANSSSIIITSGHTIIVRDNRSIDQTTVNGNITINSTFILTVTNAAGTTELVIASSGSLTNNGTLTVASGSALGLGLCQVSVNGTFNNLGAVTFGNTLSKLSFLANSIYNHQFTTTAGTIPGGANNTSWNASSTCLISGYTTNNIPPANLGQSFGHFTWNTPNLDLSLALEPNVFDLNGALNAVRGDINIVSTGINGDALYLTRAVALTLANVDNLNVNGGVLVLTGDASPLALPDAGLTITCSQSLTVGASGTLYLNTNTANVNIDINGSLINSGALDLNASSGVTNINLAGDITTIGALSILGGTASIVNLTFDGATQTLNNPIDFVDDPILNIINVTVGNGISTSVLNLGANFIESNGNFLVEEFSELNIGEAGYIEGSGNFTLRQSSVLRVASTAVAGAIQSVGPPYSGNIRTSGTRNYNSGSATLPSTIIYNGTSLQRIGSGHPSAAGINTTIANSSGVTMVANVSIGGLLYLNTGDIIIGSRTLTLNDSFTADPTRGLNVTSASNIHIGVGDAGPFGTLLTKGSTAINDLAFSRNGVTLNIGNDLTINGTLTHDSDINFAGFKLDITGPYTTTGGSLIGNATSTLIISGSGAITGSVSLSGVLGTLTINRPVGITNTTSITIATALNVLSGTYQGTGTVTLNSGATLTRSAGVITKTLSVSSYNLIYTNGGSITTGGELVTSPTTALNNLTINGGNTVQILNTVTTVTVNGTFSLLGGNFDSNAKAIVLNGGFVSSATGTFTGSLVTFANSTTISGTVSPQLDKVEILSGATLNLGTTVDLSISGDFTPLSGSIMIAGTRTTTFNGISTINLADNTTVARFNNFTIASNSTLIVSCTSCGAENSRPYLEIDGNWNSNNVGVVFTPSSAGDKTAVRLTGSNVNIGMAAGQSFWDLRTQGTGTATLLTSITVANDLDFQGTKALTTGPTNFGVNIGGDMLFNGGTFTPNQGTVTFNGSSIQVIDGSGSAPEFYNITINQTGGNFSVALNANLQNMFLVSPTSAGTAIDFDGSAGTDVFTLLSTSARTASIAALPDPTIVSGNITAQRFMSGGEGKIFRYMSSPINGARAVDLQGEIPVTGSFTGTSFPPQSNCTGCVPCTGCINNNQTMYRLNETLPGTSINQRYEDFPQTANTETFDAGRGYSVYVREGIAATTWNLRGPINKGTIPITTVTYSGAGSVNGWNLVGNPYASTIDWFIADGLSSWTRTNIDPTIYLWDESINNYATYNRAVGPVGSGTFGGSRYISTGQAFFIRATGVPTFTAREGIKANQQTIEFIREASANDFIRLTLISNSRERDQVLIHTNVEGATDNYDQALDSYKFPGPALNLYTLTNDAQATSINVIGGMECNKEIKLGLSGTLPGTYSIRFNDFESFQEPIQIFLMDKFTSQSFEITSAMESYEFIVSADSTSFGEERFKILFSKTPVKTDLVTQANDVCQDTEGIITILSSEKNVVYFATLNGTVVSENAAGNGGSVSLIIPKNKLESGEHKLIVMASPAASCAAIPFQQPTLLKIHNSFSVTSVVHGSSCNAGSVSLYAYGAPEGGRYLWYENSNSTEPILEGSENIFVTPVLQKTSTYYVEITNELGCKGERFQVKAEIIPFEVALVTISSEKLISNHLKGNQWYLDGIKIDGATEKEFRPLVSGRYTLEVTFGNCLSLAELVYAVTSLEDKDLAGIEVFPNPVSDILTINVQSVNQVKICMFTLLGRKISNEVMLKQQGKGKQTGQIDVGSIASGIYFIQIQDGSQIKLKKIHKK